MRAIRNLTFAAYGMHLADQIALVAVPLVAALVFGASAQVIGLLVACQSMAHLLGSLPFGLIIDRTQARTVAIASTLISLAGFGGAALSILGGSLVGFGAFVVVGGFGIVVFVLVSLSILPRLAQPSDLARANARLDLARALCSFAVPLTIGLIITTRNANWVFVVAAAGGLLALVSAIGLPRFPVSSPQPAGIFSLIREGGRFVLRHQLLLPIALCAVLWNLAFAALLAIMVPLAVDIYLAEPGVFGIALSAFGLAATLGAFTVGRLSAVLPTSFFLLFGPGSSVVAILLLFAVAPGGSVLPVYAAFFILGFGPSMWLTTQNSVRQLVTPAAMLGRVNAVIQTAIYGIRPIGALLGGFIAGTASPYTALVFVAAAYAGSFAVPLFSRLRKVRRFTDLTIMEAG